jgi:uncharacterized protein
MIETTRSRTLRKAILAELTKRVNGLGRTGVMKIMYLLQAVRGVDLGYSFRLYTYGPYDTQVLDDLNVAEREGIVRSETFDWQGGRGYLIKAGHNADHLVRRSKDALASVQDAIIWAASNFGSRTASDLEVISTIIFVDRAFFEAGEKTSASEVTERVHEIKPHHNREKIAAELSSLRQSQLLRAVA